MSRKTAIGLLAVAGVCLTAGISLPLANVLKLQFGFTPEQLLMARGYLTAILTFTLTGGRVRCVDKRTYFIAPCVAFASLGLYKANAIWGSNPAVIIIAATPLINFLFTWRSGKRVVGAAITGLTLMLVGMVAAFWKSSFSPIGCVWIVFATICNGILLELFVLTGDEEPLPRCFWGSIGIGTIGLMGSFGSSWTQLHQPVIWLVLIGFAFIHGYVYWICNLIAFGKDETTGQERLPKDVAAVLVQGEAPVTIIFAQILSGESLTLIQWCGVVVILVGSCKLLLWMSKPDNKK